MRWLLLGLSIAGCATVPVRVRFDAPELHRVGRFERDGRFVWSASRLSVRFDGSGPVRARFRQLTRPASVEGPPQPLRLHVALDGTSKELYADERGELVFEAHVPPGKHRLTFVRQSEALVGEAKFVSLELPAGAKLEPWPRAPLLEFIGDSVTVGFGDEGREPCRYSSKTQAITAAFPWLVGAALKADVRVVGWSGHGVIRNWGDRQEPVVPEQWSPAEPQPELVFIALGANDWWNGDPGPRFVTAYVQFVSRVRAAYPKAHIFSVAQSPRTELLLAAGADVIPLQQSEGGGCVGHPDRRSQRAIADQIIERVCAGETAGYCERK